MEDIIKKFNRYKIRLYSRYRTCSIYKVKGEIGLTTLYIVVNNCSNYFNISKYPMSAKIRYDIWKMQRNTGINKDIISYHYKTLEGIEVRRHQVLYKNLDYYDR